MGVRVEVLPGGGTRSAYSPAVPTIEHLSTEPGRARDMTAPRAQPYGPVAIVEGGISVARPDRASWAWSAGSSIRFASESPRCGKSIRQFPLGCREAGGQAEAEVLSSGRTSAKF